MRSGWSRLQNFWVSLDRRTRTVVIAGAALLLLAWLASPLYGLAVALVGVAAAAIYRLVRTFPRRDVLAAGISLVLVGMLGLLFRGSANPPPSVPDQSRSITLSLSPSQDQVRALVAIDPASADVWLAAGFTLPRDRPTDPGVVAFERVLLLDPSQSRAALELASTFLALGRNSLNEGIAAYYTELAGYPAPPLERQP